MGPSASASAGGEREGRGNLPFGKWPSFLLLIFFSFPHFSMLSSSSSSSWIQHHIEPQADSLLEQSARGEAEMWTKLDCVVLELEAMGDAPAGLPFKMAVAVYLRGKHLAQFIEQQPQGLFGLMVDTSPNQTFFRLLAACISVSNGIFEDAGMRNASGSSSSLLRGIAWRGKSHITLYTDTA
jgi:hypothetical protein